MPQERRSSSNAAVSAAPSAAPGDPAAETARFHAALAQAKAELGVLAAENDIFAAHLEMADDPMLAEQVEERISEHGFSAERALDGACEEVCGMLAALDDEYLGGRTDDVRDVCGRIRRILTGETAENPFAGLAPGTIVVAEELTPSDTALMDFSRIAGVVTAAEASRAMSASSPAPKELRRWSERLNVCLK